MADDESWVSIPSDLYERLEWLAGSSGRSVRDLVLDALAGLAAGVPPDAERDEVAARLASLGYIDE
jgi:hypothetical protein